ncbi:MAG: FAD-dependent monooxygenase [Alphaproteobacteria bacterium]|nr:FAD-dependent monooxygenase [Alphaproteobacteria bacterium]
MNHPPSVAVCGGGLAGLALATLLARDGHRPVVFESRMEREVRSEGLFLTLAPNGLAALRAVGVEQAVRAAGMTTRALEIGNHLGRTLARIDHLDPDRRPADMVTIGRGVLVGIVLDAAREAGVELRFGMRLANAQELADDVVLDFAAASRHRFDMVVAADGLTSALRAAIFPAMPRPRYTGLTGTGGMIAMPDVPSTEGVMRMSFGRRAFFGYQKAGDGPVYWFNSYPVAERDLMSVEDPVRFAAVLRQLHAGDPEPVGLILRAVPTVDRHYPIYDMPALPTWHTDRVVLVGDAAHAVAPHSGQGASMALEDAVVLAACLREAAVPAAAFVRFEALRRDRTDAVIRIGRRNGSGKMASNALARFLRDFLLPLFIPIGMTAARRIATFRVDREPLAKPPAI